MPGSPEPRRSRHRPAAGRAARSARPGPAAFACLCLLACAPAPSAPAPAHPGSVRNDDPLRLAEAALDRGDYAGAAERYRRIALERPASHRVHLGLGRIAAHAGRWVEAEAHFEAALAGVAEASDGAAEARIGLADAARERGDAAAARRELLRALDAAPWNPRCHARLAALTGLAPRVPLDGPDAVAAAEAHPYDPWALLAAGRALARAGDPAGAADALARAVWLGDADPTSSAAAADLLVAMPGEWSGQTVIPVHLYADESLRAGDGWRFQLRTALLSASNGLAPLLGVRFRPVSIRSFESAAEPADMDSIHGAFTRASAVVPEPGILAAFTARPAPAGRDEAQNGLAEFLGRRLTVRLAPREVESRVLIHEILHLYGAIHVTGGIESLMNPDGESRVLDPLSYATARSLRHRVFDGEGFERDVLAHVDLPQVNDAYADALSANLAFREAGIADALAAEPGGGGASDVRLRSIRHEDPHLADVAAVVASLMLAERRTDDAVLLLETAANLYGRKTPKGRQSAALAAELRRAAARPGDR